MDHGLLNHGDDHSPILFAGGMRCTITFMRQFGKSPLRKALSGSYLESVLGQYQPSNHGIGREPVGAGG